VHEFFTNQLTVWTQLQAALLDFEKNKQGLERDAKAAAALTELNLIHSAENPYGMLQKVAGLISTVNQINDSLIAEKRDHAVARVEQKIAQLQQEIEQSGMATPDLSNQLLRPLQLVKGELQSQKSIPQIYMLQTETANERLDDALELLNKAIEREQAKRQEAVKQTEVTATKEGQTAGYNEGKQPINKGSDTSNLKDTTKPKYVPLVKPKPVVEVSVSDVVSAAGTGVYIETSAHVEQFVTELTRKLEAAIANDNRIRLKF
jgi:hypothetical protein